MGNKPACFMVLYSQNVPPYMPWFSVPWHCNLKTLLIEHCLDEGKTLDLTSLHYEINTFIGLTCFQSFLELCLSYVFDGLFGSLFVVLGSR